MPQDLSIAEVKSIVKGIGKSVDLKIKEGSIFVEKKVSLPGGIDRYCFFISKGGHGVGKWATGIAANWVANVAMGVAGEVASAAIGANATDIQKMGPVGGGVGALGSKGSGLLALDGAFKDGVIRDAREIEKIAGAGNLIHLIKAQDALVYFGALDMSGTSSFGLWGGLGNDKSGVWDFYLRQIKDNQVTDLNHHFNGEYDKAAKVLKVKKIGDKIDTVKLS